MSSNLSTTFKAPQTSEEWINLFLKSCKSGDLEWVKQLCSPEFKAIADIHAENELGFQLACREGQLDVVQFLTTSRDLLESGHSFVDIHGWDEGVFRLACNNGHFEVVKFLTTSQDLLEAGHTFVDIHIFNESGFRTACGNGHLEIVQFLTTSKDLLESGHSFADIHADNERGFEWACNNGHLEIVKFLTTSPELLEAGHTLVNIHGNDEEGFQWACSNHHWNVIQFLIFDLKIERTPTINTIIKKYPQAQDLFKVREEQEQIQQSLIESHLMLKNPTPQDQAIKSDTPFRI